MPEVCCYSLGKLLGRKYIWGKNIRVVRIFPIKNWMSVPPPPPPPPFSPCVRIFPVASVLYRFSLVVKKLIFLNKGRINQLKPRIMSAAKGHLWNILMTGTRHPYDCRFIRSSLWCCKNRPYFPGRTLLYRYVIRDACYRFWRYRCTAKGAYHRQLCLEWIISFFPCRWNVVNKFPVGHKFDALKWLVHITIKSEYTCISQKVNSMYVWGGGGWKMLSQCFLQLSYKYDLVKA